MSGAYSRLFDRALVLAALVHENAARKGTIVPYVIHPVHVATMLVRYGYPESLAVAGLLHDVFEDIDYENGRLQLAIRSAFPRANLPDVIAAGREYRSAFRAFMEQEFPGEVLALVDAVTEPKNPSGPRLSWDERKQHTLAHLSTAAEPVAALKAADALHNVRSILEDIEHHGATVFNRFTVAPDKTLWYYRNIASITRDRLGSSPLADELWSATDALERLVAGHSTGTDTA
jgi:(p)ppGpp synthase/HD superfamily hydrolase